MKYSFFSVLHSSLYFVRKYIDFESEGRLIRSVFIFTGRGQSGKECVIENFRKRKFKDVIKISFFCIESKFLGIKLGYIW